MGIPKKRKKLNIKEAVSNAVEFDKKIESPATKEVESNINVPSKVSSAPTKLKNKKAEPKEYAQFHIPQSLIQRVEKAKYKLREKGTKQPNGRKLSSSYIHEQALVLWLESNGF